MRLSPRDPFSGVFRLWIGAAEFGLGHFYSRQKSPVPIYPRRGDETARPGESARNVWSLRAQLAKECRGQS
jgi:hypothetical protein